MTKSYKSKNVEIMPFERKFRVKKKIYSYTSLLVCDGEWTFYGITDAN